MLESHCEIFMRICVAVSVSVVLFEHSVSITCSCYDLFKKGLDQKKNGDSKIIINIFKWSIKLLIEMV
jgi:hypothetical protein